MDDLTFLAPPVFAPAQELDQPAVEVQEVHASRAQSPEEQRAIEALFAAQPAEDWANSPVVQWMVLTAGVGLVMERVGDHARPEQDREKEPGSRPRGPRPPA
jgi:hypothetical protein